MPERMTASYQRKVKRIEPCSIQNSILVGQNKMRIDIELICYKVAFKHITDIYQ